MEHAGSIRPTAAGETGFPPGINSILPYCEIRDVAIENPFYTYCANHPHRRPARNPVPIGPVMRGDAMMNRSVLIPSPDSEQVRRHLLDILADIFFHASRGRYPAGPSLADVVISQPGEFRAKRAVGDLERICEIAPDFVADIACAAPEKIRGQSTTGGY